MQLKYILSQIRFVFVLESFRVKNYKEAKKYEWIDLSAYLVTFVPLIAQHCKS